MIAKSMTINQAAAYLGKSRCTLYRWHNEGHLVYHHVGYRTEYEAEDVVRTKHPNLPDARIVEILTTLP